MPSCPTCSFENSPDAFFCVNCGQLMAHAPISYSRASEAERRFVTIMFADISGFTSLTESHDPELVREVINACFDLLVPIVERYNGVVDQFVGDAIVSLFGAPVAHENDPAQACRAALDMLQVLDEINRKYQLALGLHIGINSGMVLAGGIGSRGRQQYSVLGDAVNLASRLQDAAENGEIFVGEETHRLTRDHFEYAWRGTMNFKGKSEPQPVWQLLGQSKHAPAHRRISTETPLLGRDRELALLRRITSELEIQGSGLRVVSILGDAGLGKSRLVQEWRSTVPAPPTSSPQFLMTACAPDSSGRAFAMLNELAHALGSPAGAESSPTPLQTLLGEAANIQNASASSGPALQARYIAALRELIAARAAQASLVLVCEDLHWADAPSVHVLERALVQLAETPLIVVFTSRVEIETPGWTCIQSMQELPGASAIRLNLAPLAAEDTNALLDSLLPGALPPEIQQLVLTQSEGNPLFIEELARMLVDRGDLKREQETWVLTRSQISSSVPNTLQGVLMARVDQLPPDARRVLQIASVLGREFSLETLQGMIARLDQPR